MDHGKNPCIHWETLIEALEFCSLICSVARASTGEVALWRQLGERLECQEVRQVLFAGSAKSP